MQGIVVRYNAERGFGFLRGESSRGKPQTRKLGELMELHRQQGKMAKAGRPEKIGVLGTPILLEQGIDKNLAIRAREAARGMS